ncbi:MAG: hypothetical protein AAGJ82_02270 [Bacteroidota bacterium]
MRFTVFFFLLSLSVLRAQVVINEVYPATNQVELKNIGNDVINMLNGQLFNGFQGSLFFDANVPTECGDFIMTPGEITVVTYDDNINPAGGQLLLNGASGTPISFVQWGSSQSLATFAVGQGVWDDHEDYIDIIAIQHSIELIDPDQRRRSAGYGLQANPSLCADNTLCAITEVDLRLIECHDNETPADPTDDYITFLPRVAGLGIVGPVELSAPGITFTPSSVPAECVTCSVATQPGTANGQDFLLTLTANAGGCDTTLVLEVPESCSPVCSLLFPQVINATCVDNGSGTDPSDDYIEFLFQVFGTNTSPDGYFLTFPNGVELGPFDYEEAHLISTQNIWAAGQGDFTLVVEDADAPNCTTTITVLDPGSCSEDCFIEDVSFPSFGCNDNNTPGDPSDDLLEFSIIAQNPNGSEEGFFIVFPNDDIAIGPFLYAMVNDITVMAPVDPIDGFVQLKLVDGDDPQCDAFTQVPFTGSCSEQCAIGGVFFVGTDCNDNGTPSDPNDDYMDFNLVAQNANGSEQGYFLTFADGTELGPLAYSELHELNTQGIDPNAEGFFQMILRDADDTGCIYLAQLLDVGPCSDGCGFSGIDLTNVQCNDAGTATDPSDDFLTFNLEVQGNNLAAEYQLEEANQLLSFTPNTGSTLTLTTFATSPIASAEEEQFYTIILEDATTANCTISEVLVNPGTCSEECVISIDSLLISCNNNATPGDQSDDFFELWIRISGINTDEESQAALTPFSDQQETLVHDSLYHFSTAPGSAQELEVFFFTVFDLANNCIGITLNGVFEYDCILTPTREIVGRERVRLFPNPTTSNLTLALDPSLQNGSRIWLEVRNVQGQLLEKRSWEGIAIDVGHWPAGSYEVRVYGEEWASRQLLIKL